MLLGSSAQALGTQESAEEAYFTRWEEQHLVRLADAVINVTGTLSSSAFVFSTHSGGLAFSLY